MFNFIYNTTLVPQFFSKVLKKGYNLTKIKIQINNIKQFKNVSKIHSFNTIFLNLLYKNRIFVELFKFRKAKKLHLVPHAIRKKRTTKNFSKCIATLQKRIIFRRYQTKITTVVFLYQKLVNNIMFVTKKRKNMLVKYTSNRIKQIKNNRFYFHYRWKIYLNLI